MHQVSQGYLPRRQVEEGGAGLGGEGEDLHRLCQASQMYQICENCLPKVYQLKICTIVEQIKYCKLSGRNDNSWHCSAYLRTFLHWKIATEVDQYWLFFCVILASWCVRHCCWWWDENWRCCCDTKMLQNWRRCCDICITTGAGCPLCMRAPRRQCVQRYNLHGKASLSFPLAVHRVQQCLLHPNVHPLTEKQPHRRTALREKWKQCV